MKNNTQLHRSKTGELKVNEHTGRGLRILHVPGSVAGNAHTLCLAERSLGMASQTLAFSPNKWWGEDSADQFLFREGESLSRQEFKRWKLVLTALRNYDTIHYNFGSPILDPFVPRPLRGRTRRYSKVLNIAYDLYRKATGMRDLPLMKRAGKVIFVTYQGFDARQDNYCLANFPINHLMGTDTKPDSPEKDEWKQRRIAYFARYADRIFALNPDLLDVLPPHAQFLPYTAVDLNEWKPTQVTEGPFGFSTPLPAAHGKEPGIF